jgi:uncharacterized protein YjbJ (UPF0337 family)
MLWSEIEARWDDLSSTVQGQWTKLTDEDLITVAGRRMKLIGRIQRRYHQSFRVVRDQVDGWADALARKPAAQPPRTTTENLS